MFVTNYYQSNVIALCCIILIPKHNFCNTVCACMVIQIKLVVVATRGMIATMILKVIIFSQKKPFDETFSKITIKVSKELSFSRKPAKSEMLPHAI